MHYTASGVFMNDTNETSGMVRSEGCMMKIKRACRETYDSFLNMRMGIDYQIKVNFHHDISEKNADLQDKERRICETTKSGACEIKVFDAAVSIAVASAIFSLAMMIKKCVCCR